MPNFLRISEKDDDPEEDVVEHADDGVEVGSPSGGGAGVPFVLLVFIAGELLEWWWRLLPMSEIVSMFILGK